MREFHRLGTTIKRGIHQLRDLIEMEAQPYYHFSSSFLGVPSEISGPVASCVCDLAPTWQDLYIWLCYAEVIQYQCVCVTILLVSSLPRWIVRLFFINYVGCIMSWLWPNMTPNSWIPQKRPTAFKIVAPRRASIHKFTVSYPPQKKIKNPGFFWCQK